MGSGNDSILDMYLYETNTLLEQLDGILLAAEEADTFSEDSVNEIFRIMHTIKGSSAMMEFNSLMTVAHRIEDLFFLVREKSMDVVPEQTRPELFDMLFQAVDFFRGEIEKVENEEPLSQSIDHIVNKINSLIDKIQGNSSAPAANNPAEPESAAAAGEAPAPATADAVNQDYPYGIHVFFDEGSGMENLRAFMLLNGIKDYCGDFVSSPENVETDPSTSDHIADQGFRHVSVEPVVGSQDCGYSFREEDLPGILEEYERLAAELLKRDDVNFFHFNVDLSQGPCVIKRMRGCGAGCEYVAITPEGDIYPCHQFVGNEEYKLGNLYDGSFDMELSRKFAGLNIYTRPDCKDCWARFYCSGGCSASNLLVNGDIKKPNRFGCDMQRKRLECAIAMRAIRAGMAGERP